MAIDNTPPRLKLIITIAVITVTTLFALNLVLTSYFGIMSDEAQREKIAPTSEKYEQRTSEQAALAAANIDRAMTAFGNARGASITPEQSTDTAPMKGWSSLPKIVPAAALAAADAGAPMMAGDGGTGMMTMDGGTSTMMEAGAPKAPMMAGDAGAMAPKK